MTPDDATIRRSGCVVVGLGVLGGAALLALAESGVDCIGFDAAPIGHPDGGSGGGETRIFRSVVGDGPEYRRLLDRSREVWSGVAGHCFTPCGALTLGPAGEPRLRGVAAGRTRILGAAEIAERWPAHRPGPSEVGVFDPRGGLLDAPGATRALVDAARAAGAEVWPGTAVLGVGHRRGRAVVRTATAEIVADAVVLATGHRVPLHDGGAAIEQRRVVLSWFPVADPALFRPDAFPPGVRTGERVFSFFPTIDDAVVKINVQRAQPAVADPDDHHPPVEPGYARLWAPAVAARLAGLSAVASRVESYVEGYTAHGRGIVTLARSAPRIVTLGGFSGQGFKYAPAVGEIVADLVRTGRGHTPAFTGVVAAAG